MDSGVYIPTTMLLSAKSRWYYVGSWMYSKLVELSAVSWGCVVVSLNYDVNCRQCIPVTSPQKSVLC